MELKNPSPLGEKKINERSITEDILKIARDKEFERRQRTKISLPSLNIFKGKHRNKQPLEDVQSNISTQSNIQQKKNSNLYTFIQKLKTLSWSNIKIYISTHREQVTNISLIIIPLFILLILIVIITSYTRSQPYRVANEFMQAIEEKNISLAYTLTSDAYKAVTTEKEFKKVVDNVNTVDISNRRVKSKRIENEKEMGQYAYIRYKVSGSYLDLVVYNDTLDWRVHSIELSSIK